MSNQWKCLPWVRFPVAAIDSVRVDERRDKRLMAEGAHNKLERGLENSGHEALLVRIVREEILEPYPVGNEERQPVLVMFEQIPSVMPVDPRPVVMNGWCRRMYRRKEPVVELDERDACKRRQVLQWLALCTIEVKHGHMLDDFGTVAGHALNDRQLPPEIA